MGKKSHTTQVIMTEGIIWKQLLAFSMPLLVGNFISAALQYGGFSRSGEFYWQRCIGCSGIQQLL